MLLILWVLGLNGKFTINVRMVTRMRVYPYNFYPSSSYMKTSIVASKKKETKIITKNFDK